jgi:prophage regulatory protein
MAMPATDPAPTGESLLKLPQVLSRLPFSRSGWYQGIKEGRHPKPIKLGARAVAWKRSDIDRLIESLTA